jgi:TetR/AcrR family transcriptional regulator, regulator of cefoperazone and chloramphenicol sensitivity
MMNKKKNIDFPKDRILDKAEVLFARKGYDAVTVREITSAAKCNLAAVNYHFGNKKNLYIDVFRERWVPRALSIQEAIERELASRDDLTLRAFIQAVARAFLEGPMTEDERELHFQLMVRELAQPSEAFEIVAGGTVRPFLRGLGEKVGGLLPDGLEEENLMLSMLSVFAMVIHLNFARVLVTILTGRKYDAAFKARLVDHIIEFSLHGLGRGQGES